MGKGTCEFSANGGALRAVHRSVDSVTHSIFLDLAHRVAFDGADDDHLLGALVLGQA